MELLVLKCQKFGFYLQSRVPIAVHNFSCPILIQIRKQFKSRVSQRISRNKQFNSFAIKCEFMVSLQGKS